MKIVAFDTPTGTYYAIRKKSWFIKFYKDLHPMGRWHMRSSFYFKDCISNDYSFVYTEYLKMCAEEREITKLEHEVKK